MKVWISKYALTQGIFEIEAEDRGEGMIKDIAGSFQGYYHGEGKDWHKTREDAVFKAQSMRDKKVKNLRKQIDKLNALRFM